jgi:hypothetical protein
MAAVKWDAFDPDWVKHWNSRRKAESFAGKKWSLMNARDSFLLAHQIENKFNDVTT